MRDFEICDHCKKIVNRSYFCKCTFEGFSCYDCNNYYDGIFCYNLIDNEGKCNTFICDQCIKYDFDNIYEVCHFCKLPL